MDKRNVLNSPRLLELKRKKRKIFIRKLIIWGILFLIVICALSFATRIKRLNITEIQVSGNKVIDTDKIIESTQKITSGYYLWLFPKTNIFFYPKSRIKNELANEYKRLNNINISLSKQKMNISVSERTPEYTWCGITPSSTADQEDCYFLDKEGFIFDKAPFFSGEVYFKFYGNTEPKKDLPAQAGDPNGSYIGKGYFDKLIALKDVLKDMGVKPVVIYVEDGEDLKIFLSRDKILTNGPVIIIKKDADFQKIAENLKAAIETDPLKTKFKNEYANLEYIDVRFGNKVYYKFK